MELVAVRDFYSSKGRGREGTEAISELVDKTLKIEF
jgi:hypothetical protein